MKKDINQLEKMKQQYLNTSPYNKINVISSFLACVGSNGQYDEDTICDGFNDAVQVLICSLKSGYTAADSLVYPILFCVRHTIELYLKHIYTYIKYISNMKTHPNEIIKLRNLSELSEWISKRIDLCQNKFMREKYLKILELKIENLWSKCFGQQEFEYTHDISKLKKKIVNIYHIDERIPKVFNPVLKYLIHYEIDPYGDTFRYLTDRKGNLHLKEKNIDFINLLTVGLQHEEIFKILKDTKELLKQLVNEYKIGTFTEKLSREQLREISEMLPKQKEFNSKIKEIKKLIKNKYKISSNEFDKALMIIKKHREFSCNMGKEILIPFLSKLTLEKFGKCAIGREDWKKAVKGITPDELCLLKVFLEISGWNKLRRSSAYYSEELDYLYKLEKIGLKITYNICPKKDIRYVIDGMKKCGQKTYADILSTYVLYNNIKNMKLWFFLYDYSKFFII